MVLLFHFLTAYLGFRTFFYKIDIHTYILTTNSNNSILPFLFFFSAIFYFFFFTVAVAVAAFVIKFKRLINFTIVFALHEFFCFVNIEIRLVWFRVKGFFMREIFILFPFSVRKSKGPSFHGVKIAIVRSKECL